MEKQIFIENEPTTYYITEDGRLHNRKTNNWYKGSDSAGYLKYDLRWKNKKYAKFAHRLVAEAYIPNPNELPIVNHKDGNKRNNTIENLEWVSSSENLIHAYNTNLKATDNGVKNRIAFNGSLPDEEWKQFKDTTFMISSKGRIRNDKTGNLLKGKVTGKGYIEWCLGFNGIKKSYLAHRLVFQAFGGELKEGYVINHIDGNKQNNSIDNLEQVIPSQNIQHSYYTIGHKNIKKVGKYSLDNILIEIYNSCADAARQNEGCHANLISNNCNGKTKSHHGFIWKYLDE